MNMSSRESKSTQTEEDVAAQPVDFQELSPKRHRRRQQLIAAATRVLTKHGYQGMTMQLLADEAEVSVGLAYKYFASKEEVLSTVILDILSEYRHDLPAVMASRQNPVAKLAAGFDAYCQVVNRHVAGALLAYRESHRLDRATLEQVKALEVETTGLLQAAVQHGQEQGVFVSCDSFLIAYDMVMVAHMWALKHWSLSPRISIHEFVQKQLGFFLRVLIKPELQSNYLELFAD
jgi:TetR/AcrR family transcriptional regulator, cholesterol catabolism regulator